MTKIAIVCSHPIQYYSPIFRYLSKLSDLDVFYSHRPSPDNQINSGFGQSFSWDVDLLRGYKSTFLNNISRNPSVNNFGGCDNPEVFSAISKAKYDGVIVFGWYLKSYVQSIIAAKKNRTPVLVRGDSCDFQPRSLTRRWFHKVGFKAALRVFSGVIAVGEASRDFYLARGYPISRIYRSPHCVDNDFFFENSKKENKSNSDTKCILFCGRLIKRKNPKLLIDACRLLYASGISLRIVIAGSGPEEMALRQNAADSGLDVEFIGFQNQSALPELYASADVTVMPSEWETWGLVANESLASGTPVVVTDKCGCSLDLKKYNYICEVAKSGSAESLAGCLTRVLGASLPRSEFSRFRDSYSPASAAKGILSAVEQSLVKKSSL